MVISSDGNSVQDCLYFGTDDDDDDLREVQHRDSCILGTNSDTHTHSKLKSVSARSERKKRKVGVVVVQVKHGFSVFQLLFFSTALAVSEHVVAAAAVVVVVFEVLLI